MENVDVWHKQVVKENKDVLEKNKELNEKNKLVLEKHSMLVSELRAKVECPVCLVLPTEGPMASCPKGHLVCLPCHRTMATQALVNCPNCREPMGNTMSLLAKTVIENIEHECNNEGCNKMLPHKEVVRHKEELCDYRKVLCPELGCNQMILHKELVKHKKEICMSRKVLCPGNSKMCKTTLPFGELNDHLATCRSVDNVTNQSDACTLFLKKACLDEEEAKLTTELFEIKGEVFAVQKKMENSNLSFGVLMLAVREKCDRFKVTIEIQDMSGETAFSAQFNPTPIDIGN